MDNYLRDLILPNPSDSTKPFLPTAFTLSETYEKFCAHYKELNRDPGQIQVEIKDDETTNPISWGRFWEFWTTDYKYLKKLGKKTDFCTVCFKLKHTINSRTTDYETKEKTQEELQIHLKSASDARAAYNNHKITAAVIENKAVISMDYAENIMLPVLQETPGAFYFKTRRKIDIFGVTNEANAPNGSIQVNFLIDEGHKIKKGPNSVISMLDHYIRHNVSLHKRSLILYADNAGGQNKNQYLVGYLTYIVKALKRFDEIEFYFLI